MYKKSDRPSGIKKTVSRLAASASIKTVATPEPALTPEMAKVLEATKSTIVALNRRSTAQAHELGRCFFEAKAIVPEKRFGKWLKGFSDYTVRSAWNYASIYERLQDERERLEAAAVSPTVMFELAKGEPQMVAAVIDRIEAGERLTAKAVKVALGIAPKPKAKSVEFLDLGGLAGLRKASDVKMATDTAEFQRLTKSVLAEVEDAVKPLAEGKRVVKNSLAAMIELDCRHACELLNAIIAPLTPYAFDERRTWRPVELEKSTGWGQAQKLLHRLGMEPDWPGSTEFGPWVRDEVLPMLRFVVHGVPLTSPGASREEVRPLLDSAEDVDIAEQNVIPLSIGLGPVADIGGHLHA
ncbi:MAG: hypothetical protein VR78_01225 [Hoeflea sp. BRH_c9]|nr:MAG: hypothetical protein VR78_01225 [Hoeflea sp. BRH_c9]